MFSAQLLTCCALMSLASLSEPCLLRVCDWMPTFCDAVGVPAGSGAGHSSFLRSLIVSLPWDALLDRALAERGACPARCRLSCGIAANSSKIAHDILPLPGESPRISLAVEAKDILIFIFYRPRCVAGRSGLTASLALAFMVNYSLCKRVLME